MVIVSLPEARLKTISSPSEASTIAWRSVPTPESRLLVIVKVAVFASSKLAKIRNIIILISKKFFS